MFENRSIGKLSKYFYVWSIIYVRVCVREYIWCMMIIVKSYVLILGYSELSVL